MSAKIYTLGIVLLGLIVSGCATSYSDGGTASEESAFSNEVFNLEKITCWDLGTISEEDASCMSQEDIIDIVYWSQLWLFLATVAPKAYLNGKV